MYTINGVPLDNPGQGWIFRRGSQPFVELTAGVAQIPVAGLRGVKQYRTSMTAGLFQAVVNTKHANLETLNALFLQPNLELAKVGDASRIARVEFAASTVDTIYNRDQSSDMLYTLTLLDAAWRDKAELAPAAVALGAASVNVDIAGGSIAVQDGVVRVRGAASGLQVTDVASGSWFTYSDAIPAGQYLRFEAESGRAFITPNDVWAGGTEVSGKVDYDGPNQGFEITPVGTVAAPQTRKATLRVATGSRDATAAVQVRLYRAYL